MKKLSVFVDESGDFGKYEKHAPYYVISLVFHDQDNDITQELNKLDEEMAYLGIPEGAIHTEPLIRREEVYRNLLPNERRYIFTKLFYFFKRCDVCYKSFVYSKKEFDDIFKLEARIARDISIFIKDNTSFFHSFENVILYYDNGQHELSRILNLVLATEFTTYEVRRVLPRNYRLFQVADLICTLELLRKKTEKSEMTKSEQLIFHSKRDLKKDFLRVLDKKEFK